MRFLTDADLVDLWERGKSRHPLDRALLLLAMVFPEISSERMADWPMGRRNRALARVRRDRFGPNLRAWTACSHCGEKLEFELNSQALAGAESEENNGAEAIRVTVRNRSYRLPTSRDLARAAGESDPAAGAIRIAESCLMGGSPPDNWSEEEIGEIGEKLALADSFGEIGLSLHCPECDHDGQGTLDLASFLWTEIEGRVKQLLFSIHTLASAYGWSEAEILALSEQRRALYLEMVQS